MFITYVTRNLYNYFKDKKEAFSEEYRELIQNNTISILKIMKKQEYSQRNTLNIVFALLIIVVSSCSNNDFEQKAWITDQHELKSSITDSIVTNFISNIQNISVLTRTETNAVDQIDYQAILAPFITDGKEIQVQLLQQSYVFSMEEIEFINNMSEIDLATLSFALYAIEKEDITGNGRGVLPCIGAALGLGAVKEILNLQGIYSARTALQIFKAIGKRYLGYIGLAMAIYDFTICIAYDADEAIPGKKIPYIPPSNTIIN